LSWTSRGSCDCPPAQPAVLNAPAGYAEQLGITSTDADDLEFVQLFVSDERELRELGPKAIHAMKPDGMLWITYPKGGKTRGSTDLPATPW
jgi:hypothetical protein